MSVDRPIVFQVCVVHDDSGVIMDGGVEMMDFCMCSASWMETRKWMIVGVGVGTAAFMRVI